MISTAPNCRIDDAFGFHQALLHALFVFLPLPHGHGSLRPTFGSSAAPSGWGIVATDAWWSRTREGRPAGGRGPAGAADGRGPTRNTSGSTFGSFRISRRGAARRRAGSSSPTTLTADPQPVDHVFVDTAFMSWNSSKLLFVLDSGSFDRIRAARSLPSVIEAVERSSTDVAVRASRNARPPHRVCADERFLCLVLLTMRLPDASRISPRSYR